MVRPGAGLPVQGALVSMSMHYPDHCVPTESPAAEARSLGGWGWSLRLICYLQLPLAGPEGVGVAQRAGMDVKTQGCRGEVGRDRGRSREPWIVPAQVRALHTLWSSAVHLSKGVGVGRSSSPISDELLTHCPCFAGTKADLRDGHHRSRGPCSEQT